MRESKQGNTAKNPSRHLLQNVEQRSPIPDTQDFLLSQPEPLVRKLSRVGKPPTVDAHAAMLSRSPASFNKPLLLQLQRQYGNRYVQRVVNLSRKGDGEAEASPEIETAIQQARGNGQLLDSNVRIQMESAFGVDFSAVKVHTDTEADTLNQALNARAFTTGQDIFFRQGEYNPASSGGRELLAHELAHVVQQTGSIQGKLTIGEPEDKYEQEADQVASTVMRMLEMSSPAQVDEIIEPTQSHQVQRFCPQCKEELNRQPMSEEKELFLQSKQSPVLEITKRSFIEQRLTSPRIQGRWRLDRVTPDDRQEISYTRENGTATSMALGRSTSTSGGVMGRAHTWQEWGWINAEVGGRAQVSHWITKHFIFRNDGADRDFLQLRIVGQLAGNAKAEDLRYARAGAVVWGRAIERTATSPTPPSRSLFEIKDGGISAATVGDLGVIEANLPVGEGGSVRITIPLKRAVQGDFMPFSESEQPIHDVPSTVDEVDVLLGARIEADAEIETSLVGLNPLISPDENNSRANAMFSLAWESRPAPGAGSSRAESAGTEDQGRRAEQAGTSAASSEEILHRAPDSRESVSRLARKAQEAEDNPRLRLHGVSAFTTPMDRPHSRARRVDVERYFPVRNTLGPTHRTIVLPKPVTSSDADRFNQVFGR